MADHGPRLAGSAWQRPPIRRRRIQFNQALKLTRRAGCLLGGPRFVEDRSVRRPCPLPAVQLDAGVAFTVTEVVVCIWSMKYS